MSTGRLQAPGQINCCEFFGVLERAHLVWAS